MPCGKRRTGFSVSTNRVRAERRFCWVLHLYGVREFVLASFSNVHHNTGPGRQIGELGLRVVLGELRLAVEFQVEIPLRGLHGQNMIGDLHQCSSHMVEASARRMARAKVFLKTTLKPWRGTARQPTKVIPEHNSVSAECISRAKVFLKTTLKRCVGFYRYLLVKVQE